MSISLDTVNLGKSNTFYNTCVCMWQSLYRFIFFLTDMHLSFFAVLGNE